MTVCQRLRPVGARAGKGGLPAELVELDGAVVVRGSVRVVAAVATHLSAWPPEVLRPRSVRRGGASARRFRGGMQRGARPGASASIRPRISRSSKLSCFC